MDGEKMREVARRLAVAGLLFAIGYGAASYMRGGKQGKEAKPPTEATRVRLSSGTLFRAAVKPNARCPTCGALLMIGEIKEFDSGTTPSGMFAGKPVMCPRCNENFEPVWAQELFTIERKEAAGRRRR